MRKGVSLIALVALLFVSFPNYGEELPVLDCLIEPNTTIELASPVRGVIEQIFVDKGDEISEGQVLVKLQSSLEEAQFKLSQAKAQRVDEIAYYQAAGALAQKRLQRLRMLPKDELITRNELDEAVTQAKLADLQLSKARKDKYIAQLEQQEVKALLDQRLIKSPIDGVVVRRYLQIGESVENKPVLKIVQTDPLKIEAYAPAALVGLISIGMQGIISLEVPGSEPLQATVSLTDPVVDPLSGSFGVRLTMPNPDNRPLSGLKCKVRFIVSDRPLPAVNEASGS